LSVGFCFSFCLFYFGFGNQSKAFSTLTPIFERHRRENAFLHENESWWLGLKTGVLAEPVLVGRERELEELQHYLESAIQGRGTIVFVSGEAGAGKTKLVNDFLSSAKQKQDVTVLTGWCLSDAGIPYFPFMEAFSSYFSSLDKNNLASTYDGSVQKKPKIDTLGNEELELNAWLKGPVRTGLSGGIESYSPDAWKDLTFAAVKKALVSISARKPTVLFLDDVQWADSASLALLHYISRSMASEKVLVLATFRSEDLKPDNEGRPHPLAEALRLMGRDSLFKEIRLSGLNRTDVTSLAEYMIGGSVQSSLAEKLENESQGNPLFVVESLRMLSEKNCIVLDKNRWCLSTDELGIPTKIKDIILHRVGALKPNQRKILDVASVIGSKFDPELLAEVVGADTLDVLENLDTISQSSSLVVCEGTHYRFDHATSRDALYEEISPPLRKAYHSKIAEKLEISREPNVNPQVSDLAYHYSRAENKAKAVKYSLAAGQEALTGVLGTEAIKHFKLVLDSTIDDPNYLAEREIASEGLGEGLFVNANSEAIRVFERLSKETNSSLVKVRALRKAARASVIEGNYGHALEIVKRTIENPPADRLEKARFLQVKGMVETWGGYVNEGLEDLKNALTVFEEEYSLLDIIDALAELSIAYIMERAPGSPSSLGQPEKALASILRAIALAESTKNLAKEVYGNEIAFIIYNKCALLEETSKSVENSFEIVERISESPGKDFQKAYNNWMSSFITEIRAVDRVLSKLPLEKMQSFGTAAKLKFFMSSLLSGAMSSMKQDLNLAVRQSLTGAEYAEEADFFEIQAFNYENLTRQYAELGQMKQADVYYDKMERIFNETTLSGFIFANITRLMTKAVYFSSKRQWDDANRFYEEALAYYEKISPSTGIMAGIRQGYSWTLLQQGRFDDAKRQFEDSKKTMDELENRLVHCNILGYVLAPAKAEVGKEFNVRLDLVNVAKNSGILMQVQHLLPESFKIISTHPLASLHSGSIDMEKKRISPFHDEAITFTVQATKAGTFNLDPEVTFTDDMGENKICTPKPVAITVQLPQPKFEVLPGRVSTGSLDLDKMLLGGIPENYGVALTAGTSDERERLVSKFLEAGTEAGDTTLYLTVDAGKAERYAETNQSNFSLFLCNPQAETTSRNLPNVHTLKGVENLTEIDIALTKYLRALDSTKQGTRRACIQIVSDILLEHHAITTRKWLSGLLPSLKSKGFTTLAIIDPSMHPSEETQAVLGLFEGEIRISEKETTKGLEKSLRIRKLYNQRYLENELILNNQK
jgi:KaiC/GvpD/RAD55 family RecA-like ATPase